MMDITSCDFFSKLTTRTGIFLMGKLPASVTCRDSSTKSLCAVEQQVKIRPWASSSALKALAWCSPCTTVPEIFLHLQEPQAPSLQP